jgi:hypothetical protein
MILTEDEAKTKICQETIGSARLKSCLGTACMAWRWEDGTVDDDQLIAGKCFEYAQCPDSPPGDGWELCTDPHEMSDDGSNVWRRRQVPRGYCGKAGRISPATIWR